MKILQTCVTLLLALVIFFPHHLRSEDEVTHMARQAFAYDPSQLKIQLNAGFRTLAYRFSCDASHIFTISNAGVSVYDRPTLRLVKAFPFRIANRISAHPSDPSLMVVGIDPKAYAGDDGAALLVDWTKGVVVGHVSSDWFEKSLLNIQPIADAMIWNKVYGYYPARDVLTFTGYGFVGNSQSGAWFCNGDSMVVVGSNIKPYVWDMTHIHTSNLSDAECRLLLSDMQSLKRMKPYDGVLPPIDNDVLPPLDDNEQVTAALPLKNNEYVVGTSFGRVLKYDARDNVWREGERVTYSRISSIDVTSDEKKILTADDGSSFSIWDNETFKPLVQVINYYPFGVTVCDVHDNYYYEQMELPLDRFAHMTKNNQVFSFGQMEYIFNRPDIIAETLNGPSKYTELLHGAWRKRLKRANIDEGMLKADFHVPEVTILNTDELINFEHRRTARLRLLISDTEVPLDRLHIYVNGVPEYDDEGKNIYTGKCEYEFSGLVHLSDGMNHVSIVATNRNGARSYEKEITVESRQEIDTRNLWVVSIGVSDYTDKNYALHYAAKDARDISAMFKDNVSTFDSVNTITLTDSEFTSYSFGKLYDFLGQVRPNDAVIVFFAGHGVLDSNLDYYLAPADMDFSNPKVHGVGVERLLKMLRAIPTNNRYLIIDACHSGSIDKDELLADNTTTISAGDIRFRNVGGARYRSSEAAAISQLASDIFMDESVHSGIVVISSSRGNEVSLESPEWENGLFTFALKEGLSTDPKTGEIRTVDGVKPVKSLEYLVDYAKRRTYEISEGRQNPTIRSNNHYPLSIRP